MSLSTTDTGSHRKLLITCPSCSTKFALPSSIAEEKDEIRFHCSRCDRQFSLLSSELEFEKEPLKTEPDPQIHNDIKPSGLKREPFTMGWGAEPMGAAKTTPPETKVSKPYSDSSELLADKDEHFERQFDEDESEDSSRTLEFDFPYAKKKELKYSGAVFTLLLPLALIMIFLASFSLALSLGFAGESFAAFNGGARKVPPTGLVLKDVTHDTTGLSDALIIAGTVRNFESEPVRGIEIEAVIFDGSNNQIAARRLHKDQFSLNPGQQKEFSLALSGDDAHRATYYSVRIHSVGK